VQRTEFPRNRSPRHKIFFSEINRKISNFKRPFLQTPKNNKVSIYKEYKIYYKQKVWYIDKAALLPGANTKFMTAFVQKNKFYKKIYSAYEVFKTYYAFSKKSL
jgi:predicted AlkP superfamily pyrophosphatase or phosphodiesterase